MKYLDFKSFAHLAELCQRQNGKTTEAVKATLNRLMDISGPSRILFVGQNNQMTEHSRQLFTEKLKSARPELGVEITVNNQSIIRFTSCTGEKSISFTSFGSMPIAARGMTLDDIIFDIDLATVFKTAAMSGERFLEIYQSIAPTMIRGLNA